jgi:type IV pilus assembly protein PilE
MKTAKGFTLIEVMIVLALIGILSAIAFPNYQEYIKKGQRSRATADLLVANQWMERYYSENLRYTTTLGGTTNTEFTTRFAIGSPLDGASAATKLYDITLTAVADRTFTIRLAPTGGMAGDKCGNYSITNTGIRAVSGTPGMTYCWR